MGIRYLNKFLQTNCKESSIKRYIEEYVGKTLVIDTNIFMYKYKLDDRLYEKIYMLCSMFHRHKVTPVFVFDGKSRKNKSAELEKRRNVKEKAKHSYDEMLQQYKSETNEEVKETISAKLVSLHKQMIYITRNEINEVKSIIRGFGMQIIQAKHEGDEICAYLCKTGKAYACVSDDMDMFAYGCPIICKYLSVINESFIEYDVKKIVNELDVTIEMFQKMCILSGTDYHSYYNVTMYPIYKTYKKLFMFHKSGESDIYHYITNNEESCSKLKNIEQQYLLVEFDDNIIPEESSFSKESIINVMTKHKFYFV